MMARSWLALLAAGCSGTTPGGPMDARVDVQATVDAAPCVPPPAAAFSAPKEVTALSSTLFDGKPSLTADRLEVFFKSGRPDNATVHLFHSSRTSTSAAWSTPALISELDSGQYDTTPTISSDGLTLWFVSYRSGGPGGGDFYVAKRASRTSTWGPPRLVVELNTTEYEDGLTVEPDELVAYFHSSRGGSSVNHIYRTSRGSTSAPWGTPIELPELVSSYDDTNPWISLDECSLYFDSSRPGGQGQYDVFVALRPAPGAPFSLVSPIAELNSTSYDADPFLSQDQHYIMYTSNRPMAGDFNLYEATR
jgi:Tol biopolymer transport system component